MKIQVVIEATSIQEYTEAIQALAAGYKVTIVKEENTYAEASKAVDSDEVKVAEEKPKKNTVKAPKEEKNTAAPKAEDKVSEEKTEAPKYGFPAVKQIAMKLSKITDGKAEVKALLEHYSVTKLSDLAESQYDDFHADATQLIADHDNAPAKEDKPKDNVEDVPSDDKEITLEMIRSKAKELSVAGFKEEIKAALKEIGAPALTKIPKDQYASFYEAMGNIQ
ncbi:hypothetical protein vBBceSLY1_00049 [Bacillus phage vB_BceS_LY1]|uniref:Uncharacterized protein n=1 Tax=Bacillus phage vB_BceS_LY1 TaxID=2950459 RepID=A0AAE9S290_9CAUD|nr:hypothetical protein vBBceSLY1_00049 [Bacillus phage vB_BceS_LY1]